MKKFLMVIILLFFLFSTVAFTGCTSKIPADRLSYFQGLNNQKYWTKKPLNITIVQDDGQKAILFADVANETLEGIEFGKVNITQSSDKGVPQKGYISIKIINSSGVQLSSYRLDISASNEKTLKKFLAQMETNQQKVTEEAKNLIDNGNFDEAIAKLKSIQQTDEVKSLLDSIYYKIASKDFKAGNYDKALSDLSNVRFDKNIIQDSETLKSKAQKCKDLLTDSKKLIGKAEYSDAKKKLLELKSINDTKEAEELLSEIDNPWLLDATSIKEAAAYGQKYKNGNILSFVNPWLIGNPYSYHGYIFVATPYMQVASFAMDNAKKYKVTTLSDAIKLLNSIHNLVIYATVFGDDIDFATDVDAVIKVNGKAIQPVKADKKDFADTTSEWPYSPAYYANNSYDFSFKDIPRNAKIQVIIIYPDREVKFNVDLSKIK